MSSLDPEKEMKAICSLITWLDGYSNLSCVDPLKMERVLKFCDDDIVSTWNRVRKDVYSVGRLPGSSKRVLRLSRVVNISRFLSVGFALLAITFWILAAFLAPGLLSAPGRSLIVLIGFVVVFNADLAVYMFSTKRLSLAVKEYFSTHTNEAKFERKRIRDATQSLIDKLASRVKASEDSPGDHQFALLDQSYNNVHITKGKGIYVATVRLQTS